MDHLTVLSGFGHPYNGIQRIVEKMGIYLRQQGLHFIPAFFLLFPNIFRHQLLNLICHHVEGISQSPDFMVRYSGQIHLFKIPSFHPFHGLLQKNHGLCYSTGKYCHGSGQNQTQQQGNQSINQLCLGTVL